MAEVIAAAKARLNSTPMGDASLFRARQDHYLFLVKLAEGKL